LEIPALSRAVLPKPPFEPVSAKLAYLASGFYFFTWILDISRLAGSRFPGPDIGY